MIHNAARTVAGDWVILPQIERGDCCCWKESWSDFGSPAPSCWPCEEESAAQEHCPPHARTEPGCECRDCWQIASSASSIHSHSHWPLGYAAPTMAARTGAAAEHARLALTLDGKEYAHLSHPWTRHASTPEPYIDSNHPSNLAVKSLFAHIHSPGNVCSIESTMCR